MNDGLSPAILLDALRREEERRKAETSLYEFVKQSWQIGRAHV